MSYSQFIEYLKNHGVPRTDADGGELALTKADALRAIKFLSDTDIAILGGDVYELESDGCFRPTYDNWYCNKGDLPSSGFAKQSQEKASQYIENYREPGNINIRYVLVVDD